MLGNSRILFISADFSLYGSNRSLLNLLSSLQIDTENYLVITPGYGDLNKELDKLKIKHFVIKYYWECGYLGNNLYSKTTFLLRWLEKKLINFKAKAKIADVVKKGKYNIIHSNSSVISVGFEVAKKLNVRHIWHIREFVKLSYNLTPFIGEADYTKKLKQSDAIICISNSIAQFHSINGKGNIIYNAVAKKSELTEPVDKENYFLFCGAVTRNKGLHKALTAFAEICKTDKKITLKIAGNFIRHNEYYFYILNLVENLQLSERIEFLGYRTDVKNLMNSAAGLLVCSINEGMGRVTAEAMLFNCLVIGFDDKAGTSELISHNKTGLLFQTNEELVSAMQYALEEKNSVRKIIEQAKEYALKNFTEEIFRNKLVSVYENLL